MKNKTTSKIELVLVNISISSLSLKEIGEIYCYSKLVNARLALLISLNGISNEVNVLLVDDSIRNKLLSYSNNREIIICSWDENNKKINGNLVIPLDKRDFITA